MQKGRKRGWKSKTNCVTDILVNTPFAPIEEMSSRSQGCPQGQGQGQGSLREKASFAIMGPEKCGCFPFVPRVSPSDSNLIVDFAY